MGNKLVFLLAVFMTASVWAQSAETGSSPGTAPTPTPTPAPVSAPQAPDDSYRASDNPVKVLRNLVKDQKDIWTSPFKARVEDLNWTPSWNHVSQALVR
jgi:hypothetical protein